MALRFCIECGKEVSDRAQACPHCGHPVEDAIVPQKAEPPVVIVKKNAHPVLTVVGIVAIVVVVLIAILVVIAVTHKEAKFVVTQSSSDANCTQLTDYCINVYCTYQNAGNGQGEQRIHAQLLDTATSEVRADHYVDLTLQPQASQKLTFSFPEAELDWQVSYLCKVEPKK